MHNFSNFCPLYFRKITQNILPIQVYSNDGGNGNEKSVVELQIIQQDTPLISLLNPNENITIVTAESEIDLANIEMSEELPEVTETFKINIENETFDCTVCDSSFNQKYEIVNHWFKDHGYR